jgi:hypothetical protein
MILDILEERESESERGGDRAKRSRGATLLLVIVPIALSRFLWFEIKVSSVASSPAFTCPKIRHRRYGLIFRFSLYDRPFSYFFHNYQLYAITYLMIVMAWN